MIFPQIRLSELEKDTELKKHHFEKTKDAFLNTATAKLHPLTLMRENKKLVVGILLGLVAFGQLSKSLYKSLSPRLKKAALWSVNAGILWKVLDFSLQLHRLNTSRRIKN